MVCPKSNVSESINFTLKSLTLLFGQTMYGTGTGIIEFEGSNFNTLSIHQFDIFIPLGILHTPIFIYTKYMTKSGLGSNFQYKNFSIADVSI